MCNVARHQTRTVNPIERASIKWDFRPEVDDIPPGSAGQLLAKLSDLWRWKGAGDAMCSYTNRASEFTVVIVILVMNYHQLVS